MLWTAWQAEGLQDAWYFNSFNNLRVAAILESVLIFLAVKAQSSQMWLGKFLFIWCLVRDEQGDVPQKLPVNLRHTTRVVATNDGARIGAKYFLSSR